MEDFKVELEKYIEAFLLEKKEYITDMRAIKVDLLAKAEEELKLW